MTEWNLLPAPLQLHLAQQALRQACDTFVRQAEFLADEMDEGELSDLGGADALRLLATIIRSTSTVSTTVCGHA